jgi:glucose dehydrogenase
MLAAVTPTASGLVMTGTGSGDFLVFDAATGRQLYSFYTGGAMAGGVSTYRSGGKQYVAVASGNSSKALWQTTGAATLIVFGLVGQ